MNCSTTDDDDDDDDDDHVPFSIAEVMNFASFDVFFVFLLKITEELEVTQKIWVQIWIQDPSIH